MLKYQKQSLKKKNAINWLKEIYNMFSFFTSFSAPPMLNDFPDFSQFVHIQLLLVGNYTLDFQVLVFFCPEI